MTPRFQLGAGAAEVEAGRELAGRVAVVTGASRGIGRAIATSFARAGCIINVASIGGLRGESAIGVYNTTKAAIVHLTRILAMELGPDVRVNAVAPGLVKTDFARALGAGGRRCRQGPPTPAARSSRRHRECRPLPRWPRCFVDHGAHPCGRWCALAGSAPISVRDHADSE